MKLVYGLLGLVVSTQAVSKIQELLKKSCAAPDALYTSVDMYLHPEGHLIGQEDCRHGACYLTQQEKYVCRNVKVVAGIKYSSAVTGPILTKAFLSPEKNFARYDGVNIDYTEEPDDVEINLPTLVGNTKPHRIISIRPEQIPRLPKNNLPDHVFIHTKDPNHSGKFIISEYKGKYTAIYAPGTKGPSPFIEKVNRAPVDEDLLPKPLEIKLKRTTYPFSSSNLKCIIAD
ncbi:hypothetical protein DSO57_1023078 [Entomophthora muscae]|uniref:Uncharacterized protein n=1 Tax=Entomophthora muscae TaxID=34485 RepID=A0ACC2TQI3_9FUNG|nr:hypothetical protein DSO57_1023078 [Entomophthora muscae]